MTFLTHLLGSRFCDGYVHRYIFFESLVLYFYSSILHVRKLRSPERETDSVEATGCLLRGVRYTPRLKAQRSEAVASPCATSHPAAFRPSAAVDFLYLIYNVSFRLHQ